MAQNPPAVSETGFLRHQAAEWPRKAVVLPRVKSALPRRRQSLFWFVRSHRAWKEISTQRQVSSNNIYFFFMQSVIFHGNDYFILEYGDILNLVSPFLWVNRANIYQSEVVKQKKVPNEAPVTCLYVFQNDCLQGQQNAFWLVFLTQGKTLKERFPNFAKLKICCGSDSERKLYPV